MIVLSRTDSVCSRIGLAFAITLSLLGCSSAPEPPLRVGTTQWPGYETLYLARSLGKFDESSIRLVELPSSTDVIHALRNNTLEAAALTLDETLSLIQDSIDLRVVLLMDISAGADVLLAYPDIQGLPALRGRRVGAENTAVGALMLNRALEAADMTALDIQLVPLTVDAHEEAYKSKKIDALITYEPVKSRLLDQGAKVLFDSSQIPGDIIDVLVIRGEALERYSASVRRLLRGQFAALDYLQKHPDDATRRMAPRLAISPKTLMRAYQGLSLPDLSANRRLLIGNPPPLYGTAGKLVDMMLTNGLLKRKVSIEGLVDGSVLPKETP